MLKKVNILIATALFTLSFANAQTVNTTYGSAVITDLVLSEALSKSGEKTLKYKLIEGSPYNSEEFAPAEIHMQNGFIQKDIYARLDLFEGNVEVKVNGEALIMSSPQIISKVVINDESYMYFSDFKIKGPNGFYKVYYLGDSKVLGFEEVVFKEEELASNSYSEDKPDRFVHLKERMFIILESGDKYEVSSKKKFLKEMEAAKPDVYEFIRKNKLNPVKTDDLIELARALDGSST